MSSLNIDLHLKPWIVHIHIAIVIECMDRVEGILEIEYTVVQSEDCIVDVVIDSCMEVEPIAYNDHHIPPSSWTKWH